jgi:hypothetical protein
VFCFGAGPPKGMLFASRPLHVNTPSGRVLFRSGPPEGDAIRFPSSPLKHAFRACFVSERAPRRGCYSLPGLSTQTRLPGVFCFGAGPPKGMLFASRPLHANTPSGRVLFRSGPPEGDAIRFPSSPRKHIFRACFVSERASGASRAPGTGCPDRVSRPENEPEYWLLLDLQKCYTSFEETMP